jgi:hypothetical protein
LVLEGGTAQARQSTIPQLVDDAMAGIERDDPGLKGVPPKEIGIGASLTARPLPHHRAYGSVHGDSAG